MTQPFKAYILNTSKSDLYVEKQSRPNSHEPWKKVGEDYATPHEALEIEFGYDERVVIEP